MSNKKQTAVDWLVEELELYSIGESKLVHYEIIEQAKEMEKQQIIDAVSFGDCRGRITTYLTDEQYYKETYE